MRLNIIDARLLEFKMDHETDNYLLMVLTEAEDEKAGVSQSEWTSISGGKFMKMKDIWSESVKWANEVMKVYSPVSEKDSHLRLVMSGEKISTVRNFKRGLDVAMYIMKATETMEPYDNYCGLGFTILVDYINSKGNRTSKKASSSDKLEQLLKKHDGKIRGLRFSHRNLKRFRPVKMGRFYVNRDSHFVIRMSEGYFLGFLEDRMTQEKKRAVKFLTEDEALTYAFEGLNEESFEIIEVKEPDTLERILKTGKDHFHLTLPPIEETEPFPLGIYYTDAEEKDA